MFYKYFETTLATIGKYFCHLSIHTGRPKDRCGVKSFVLINSPKDSPSNYFVEVSTTGTFSVTVSSRGTSVTGAHSMGIFFHTAGSSTTAVARTSFIPTVGAEKALTTSTKTGIKIMVMSISD